MIVYADLGIWMPLSFGLLMVLVFVLFACLIYIIIRNKHTKKGVTSGTVEDEASSEAEEDYNSNELREEKRDELIFNLIKQRYDSEQERIKDLDTKANNLIGFTSIVISLLLGTGTFQLLKLLLNNPNIALPYFIGVGILLGSIIFALGGVKIRKYPVVPDAYTLLSKYTDRSYKEVLKRNAGQMTNAVEKAKRYSDRKAQFIQFSWFFVIMGLSVFFI
ncbi:MAG: hypothetical protein WA421_16900, partial [Nitrososphaeraceae archaeon]